MRCARANPGSRNEQMKAPVALRWPWTALAVSLIGLAGCAVGPKYARPSVQVPSAYKELNVGDTGQSDLWKTAQPQDAAARGNWWEAFDDEELNSLEEKGGVSNQNIAAAAANFAAA